MFEEEVRKAKTNINVIRRASPETPKHDNWLVIDNQWLVDFNGFVAAIIQAHEADKATAYERGHEDMRRKLLEFLDLHNTQRVSRKSLFDFVRPLASLTPPKEGK